MANKRKLEVVIGGDASGATRAFGDVEKRGGRLKGVFGGLGKAAVAGFAVVTAAAAGAAFGAFKIGESFDKAYDTIIVGTGATGDALEGLKDDFRAVFTSVPTDMNSAATAVADLNTRLGLTGEELQDLSTQFLELSRMTGTDLTTNIENASRVFGDWGIATEDQAEALDKIFEATKRTGISLSELTTQTVKYGAPLRQLGFGFEESLALFGKWNKEGVNTEVILGGIRQGIGRMAKAGEDVPTAFRAAIASIKEAGDESDATRIAIEAFGQRAGPDMAAAIREGRFELGDLVEGLEGAEGAIMATSEQTESFSQKWTKLKNKVLVKLEPIATKVFDAMGDAIDKLEPYFDRAVDWLGEKIPKAVAYAQELIERWGPTIQEIFGTTIDVVTTALAGLSEWWEDNGPTIMATIEDVGRVVSTVFGAIVGWVRDLIGWFQSGEGEVTDRTSRIGAILTQLADVAVMVFGTIRTAVEATWRFIADVWEMAGAPVFEAITLAFDGFLQSVEGTLTTIQGIWETFAGIFTGDWSRAWEGIKQIFEGVWDIIVGRLKTALGLLRAAWELGWAAIKALVDRAWGAFMEIAGGAIDRVVGWFQDLPGRISSLSGSLLSGILAFATWPFRKAWELARDSVNTAARWFSGLPGRVGALAGSMFTKAKEFGGAIWDGITSALEGLADKMVEPLEAGLDAMKWIWNHTIGGKGFEVPNWVPFGWGGREFKFPELATGGRMTRSGLALVGERGPELVALGRGARVYPASTTSAALGGGVTIGSITYDITVADGSPGTMARLRYELEDATARLLRELQQQGATG